MVKRFLSLWVSAVLLLIILAICSSSYVLATSSNNNNNDDDDDDGGGGVIEYNYEYGRASCEFSGVVGNSAYDSCQSMLSSQTNCKPGTLQPTTPRTNDEGDRLIGGWQCEVNNKSDNADNDEDNNNQFLFNQGQQSNQPGLGKQIQDQENFQREENNEAPFDFQQGQGQNSFNSNSPSSLSELQSQNSMIEDFDIEISIIPPSQNNGTFIVCHENDKCKVFRTSPGFKDALYSDPTFAALGAKKEYCVTLFLTNIDEATKCKTVTYEGGNVLKETIDFRNSAGNFSSEETNKGGSLSFGEGLSPQDPSTPAPQDNSSQDPLNPIEKNKNTNSIKNQDNGVQVSYNGTVTDHVTEDTVITLNSEGNTTTAGELVDKCSVLLFEKGFGSQSLSDLCNSFMSQLYDYCNEHILDDIPESKGIQICRIKVYLDAIVNYNERINTDNNATLSI
jgi:hypothetical protein